MNSLLNAQNIIIYCLYILNIYWFFIINKVIYRSIAEFIGCDKDIVCHKLCSYTLFTNVIVALCIYSYNAEEKHIFDLVGNIVLSINSYIYHYDIYLRLYHNQIQDYSLPSKDNIILFINDCLSIHLRSFLVFFTNYYNSSSVYSLVTLSVQLHLICIYFGFMNILQLFIDHDKNKDTFLKYHNLFTMTPIGLDILLIALNSPPEIAVPYSLVNIAILMLFVIEPFHKLTHFSLHALLIAHNYYMCLSNVSV